MDDAKQEAEGGELPLQGPQYSRRLNGDDSPAAFFPLKLLFQPSGPVLDLTRPDMLMGRHSEADLRLPLPDVSRRHCRFLFTASGWEVFDLDSLNGVFVNGERVQHAILHDHDILTIGGFRFQVELRGSSSSAGNAGRVEERIHRIAGALPGTGPDIDSHRKAS
jgi:pSer/pThr/pTyr-binding forkhead associated (FHA) protein